MENEEYVADENYKRIEKLIKLNKMRLAGAEVMTRIGCILTFLVVVSFSCGLCFLLSK